jgi:nitrate/nitrite transporter NarK
MWLTRESVKRFSRSWPGRRARPTQARTIAAALKSGRVWLLALMYFTIPVALYGMGFWLPQIIKAESSGTDFEVGLLSAIPYVLGCAGMVLAGRHSDRTGERRWHIALAALGGGAAFVLSGAVHGLTLSLVALSLAMLGLASMFGPFWTLATSVVGGVGAAAGIALINSVGNIGGFVGPYLLGYLSDRTHSFTSGLMFIGAVLACGGVLALAVRDEGSG